VFDENELILKLCKRLDSFQGLSAAESFYIYFMQGISVLLAVRHAFSFSEFAFALASLSVVLHEVSFMVFY